MSFVDIGASIGVKLEMLSASLLFCPWHFLLSEISSKWKQRGAFVGPHQTDSFGVSQAWMPKMCISAGVP